MNQEPKYDDIRLHAKLKPLLINGDYDRDNIELMDRIEASYTARHGHIIYEDKNYKKYLDEFLQN